MVEEVDATLGEAIVMATARPARLLRDPGHAGSLRPGAPFRAAHLDPSTWQAHPVREN